MKRVSLDDFLSQKKTWIEYLEEIDRQVLEEALDRVGCNIAETARLLRISRGAVEGKMRKYGIEIVYTKRKAG